MFFDYRTHILKRGIILKQFFHSLFYLPKHEKLTDRSFMKIVISSITGIVLCCLCLASLTWAWFSEGAATNGSVIASARFQADVIIEKVDIPTSDPIDEEVPNQVEDTDETEEEQPEDAEGEGTVLMRLGSPYLLTGGFVFEHRDVVDDSPIFPLRFELKDSYTLKNFESGRYKVTIKPNGTATQFGGYFIIKAEGETPLYSTQLFPGDVFVFNIDLDADKHSSFELICVWGSLPEGLDSESVIENEFVENPSDESPKVTWTDKDVTSSDEEAESVDANSVESDVTSSEEPEGTSSQEGSEDAIIEENSSEV